MSVGAVGGHGAAPDLGELEKAVNDIYRAPLRQAATDSLNRMMRSGATDEELGKRVIELRELDQLSVDQDGEAVREPQIICSLGLFAGTRAGGGG